MASNFKVNPSNALGIDADETRSKLISLALSKPESYYKLRAAAIKSITKEIAILVYNMYWDILTVGQIPICAEDRGNGIGGRITAARSQLIFPEILGSPYSGQAFTPNLPEKECNIICSKISDKLKSIGQEIVESILPMNHLEMAQQKQVDILKAKDI